MTKPHHYENVAEFNEQSLERLVRAISLSQGEFCLLLVRCNYENLRQSIMQRLREICPITLREIILSPPIKTLYTVIQTEIGDEQPQALIILGLETVTNIDQVLTLTNQLREEFRKNFPFPLVLWINDELGKKIIRLAPDFESWSTTIEFLMTIEQLYQFLEQITNDIFNNFLDAGTNGFINNKKINPEFDKARLFQIKTAIEDLTTLGVILEPKLEAGLKFVLGLFANSSMEQARQYYEQSLVLWKQTDESIEQQGCVLYSLGLWWRGYADQNFSEYIEACIQAKNYFVQCVDLFEQHNRSELVANFINALLEVLQLLKQWDELEAITQTALALHKTYPNPFRLAQAYGILTEVALAKSNWEKALASAQQALDILQASEIYISNSSSSKERSNLENLHSYHKARYLFSLARTQLHLNQIPESIQNLETARITLKLHYDPKLYIRILEELRHQYFQQGQYLIAFQIKEEQILIEKQYGFRAFIGASRLEPEQQVISPTLEQTDSYMTVAKEISASGRQHDIIRLLEKIKHPADKLTIIHSQSGVGKSSLISAGLVPSLQQRLIRTRYALPIVIRVYTDWVVSLGHALKTALKEIGYIKPSTHINTTEEIIKQLQENRERNLLSIIIFDQFEEFFFFSSERSVRKYFYDFLNQCLTIPHVKIIFSMREDYLHYLLEINRLTKLTAIDEDILNKEILYFLGNFSPQDARSVIQSLTESSQFYLEPLLIDELVRDLARDLNEIRPIELQVVGAQLQTENITTLAQYQEQGPKEKFVGRFLEEVVKDCGNNNEQVAKLVLYLLTDENNTRPLRTRYELQTDLALEPERLDLILNILVKSGLVFQVPEFPADRYQLVHDYLVPFVREQQSAILIAELEKEHERRKLTEAKLNEVLRQQLQASRKSVAMLAILTISLVISVTSVGFWLKAESQKEVTLTQYRERIEQLQRQVEQLKKKLEEAQKKS